VRDGAFLRSGNVPDSSSTGRCVPTLCVVLVCSQKLSSLIRVRVNFGVLLCTNYNAAALAWEAPDALLAKGCFGRICIAGVLGGGVLVGCNPDRVVDLNENLNIRYDLRKFPIRL